VTEAATRHTLLLPIYATMTSTEQDYVIDHLLRALRLSRPVTARTRS
jgi:dTDP-4-amino-4,6-dideoxygalactose transaminase